MGSHNSLRLVPSSLPSNPTTSAGSDRTFGVHDTLRDGFRSVRSEVIQGHPLEASEAKWHETREKLKYTMYRQTMGAHMPMRMQMEKAILSQPRHIPALGRPNVSLDALTGNLDTFDYEDFLGAPEEANISIHESFENVLGWKRV